MGGGAVIAIVVAVAALLILITAWQRDDHAQMKREKSESAKNKEKK